MQLSNEVKFTRCTTQQTAGTADQNGSAIDMQGYDGVVFITTFGTANDGNHLKAQQDENDDSGFGDAEDLAGTKTVSTGANNTVVLDVYRPQKRYIRAVGVLTASSTIGPIFAMQYKGRLRPEDNDVTDTIASELLISPAAGTA